MSVFKLKVCVLLQWTRCEAEPGASCTACFKQKVPTSHCTAHLCSAVSGHFSHTFCSFFMVDTGDRWSIT